MSTDDVPRDPPTDGEAAPEDADLISRRRFLSWLSGLLGLAGTGVIAVPFVGFLLAPLLQQDQQVWRAVGSMEQFKVGETVEVRFLDPSPLPYAGVSAKTAAWLRRDSASAFRAFAVNCTHLGCPVQWVPDGKLFLCPCHGGVYYDDGSVAAGPPPHALFEYQVRVNGDQVEILTHAIPIA
ncbi:MAG: Rieske (2Fe-2S) protein [Chloroflexota bacterium]|nr:Rieske (2Fe-2S) protein [Chloroflexota bacterium]